MRCRHLIERNGYFTGKRCSRPATVRIALSNIEGDVIPCCTQHANMVRARWAYQGGAPVDEEIDA